MNGFLIVDANRAETRLLRESFGDLVGYRADEDWQVCQINTAAELAKAFELLPQVDLSCVDIVSKEGVSAAETVRTALGQVLLVLITSLTVSPSTYIKPTVMPAGILFRPLQAAQVRQVLPDLLSVIRKETAGKTFADQSFSVNSRGSTIRIPLAEILYFEARNKRVYLCTKNREIEFYETLDKLPERLPPQFVRCHKSYLVNTLAVEELQLGQNLLLMDGGRIQLPVSRTYKQQLREALE